MKLFFISVCTCLLLQVFAVEAGWFGADFTADVVQGSRQTNAVRGKMYVGHGRVRTEIEQNGHRSIEIINPLKGVAWILNTDSKLYHERKVPVLSNDTAKSRNPCATVKGGECRKLADEVLHGRNTHKWLVRINGAERLQWNDVRYGFPVQVVESGKLVMSMLFIAEETLSDRKVERWKARQTKGKMIVESEQWYDPELNIAIRQVAQDGSFRELQNIRLGEQEDALFELPNGYKKLGLVTQ